MQRVSGDLNGIDYHQYYLVADEDEDAFPEGAFTDEVSPHTLVVPSGHALCVSTGIAAGLIMLTIEVLDDTPASIDDRETWQAVSDVSFEATSDEASVRILMDETSSPFDHFRLSGGEGWYRARAHAYRRGVDFDAVVTENPREKHLLQLWRSAGFETAKHHRIDDQWANRNS